MAESLTSTIELTPVASSNISRIGYDSVSRTLAVEFKSARGKPSVYHYSGVEPDVFQAFVDSESKGAFLQSVIKGRGYPFQKVA